MKILMTHKMKMKNWRRHAFHSRKAADHHGAYMIDAAVQMFRLWILMYNSRQTRSMVLRAVVNTCDARRAWFEAVRSCRRRMHVKDLGRLCALSF